MPTPDLVSKLADRSSGFEYLARKVDADTAARIKKLNIAGISTVPTSRRLYPQGELAAQVIGAVGTENQGLTGLEQSENDVLGGANGEQDVVHDALGRPLRMDTVQARERRGGHPDDDRRGDPGQDRGGALAGGRALRGQGRDRDRHEPATPARSWRWPTGRATTPPTSQDATADELENRATGLHLRARLDLQGLHRRLRARGPRGDAAFELLPAARDPGRRPRRSARRMSAAAVDPDHRPDPRPVLERRRGDDRHEGGGRRASRSGSTASASADRPASTIPGEERGIVPELRRLLGLDDGQPADRPGARGDPDADGDRLRGDRQRRHPAAARPDQVGRRAAGGRATPSRTG